MTWFFHWAPVWVSSAMAGISLSGWRASKKNAAEAREAYRRVRQMEHDRIDRETAERLLRGLGE
jgi:hypothetical protein